MSAAVMSAFYFWVEFNLCAINDFIIIIIIIIEPGLCDKSPVQWMIRVLLTPFEERGGGRTRLAVEGVLCLRGGGGE
jgi:hypothetical protein